MSPSVEEAKKLNEERLYFPKEIVEDINVIPELTDELVAVKRKLDYKGKGKVVAEVSYYLRSTAKKIEGTSDAPSAQRNTSPWSEQFRQSGRNETRYEV